MALYSLTMKKLSSFLLLLCCLFQLGAAAQNLPVSIDNLTDQQIIVLMSQYQLMGLSETEMEMKAREKGLSSDQIALLKKRLALIDPSTMKEINGSVRNASDPDEKRYNPKMGSNYVSSPFKYAADTSAGLKPFGWEIFLNQDLSFQPNLQIATPQNYLIGINDQLVIDIYGVSDITKRLRVSADGDIRYPNLGPIKVAGLSIEEARIKLKKSLSAIYPGLVSGAVQIQVTLGQLRSIQVTLIGEIKRPGNYELSSLSTLMNALYASGGPNAIGSFRQIDLVRNGKNLVVFDLYDFLFKSDLTKNKILQDGDVIRVNPYTTRVALKGAVKKPALFDIKPNETAAQLIAFAGGFSDMAFKENIRVLRNGTSNKELLTIKAGSLASFTLVNGDSITVDRLASQVANRISITGAVYYPGAYGLQEYPSLHSVLVAGKPREDAYLQRALLRRLKPDFSQEFIHFSISDVLNNTFSLQLQRDDSIYIYRINDLRENYIVTINGEVNKPGSFVFADNIRVQDLVLMAGGFRDGASLQRIEVSRRLRNTATNKDSALYAVIREIDLTKNNVSDIDFVLAPFDIVSVRKSPVYKEQINVGIEGEVIFPGNYTLSGNAERISDLVKRAGGLKQKGFAGGALLVRKTYRDLSETDAGLINNKATLINTQSGIANATNTATDSATLKNVFKEQKPVGIRLDEILANPGSAQDLFLLEGDILKIPRELQTIQTFGAVNVPKQIVYYEGIHFKDAMRASGYFAMNASPKNSYVIHPNGEVRKTRNFLFFKSYPSIRPGTEIYVPNKKPKQKLSTGEVIGIVSSLTSLVSILILLINSQK